MPISQFQTDQGDDVKILREFSYLFNDAPKHQKGRKKNGEYFIENLL